MSSRSMWSGTIGFGMVVIPVRLHTATEDRSVAFHQVHRTDGGRVRMRRTCALDGQEIAFSDVAKGLELPDGSTVVLTDEDLESLPLAARKQAEVLSFTPASQVSPLMSGKSYYVEPSAQGLRAYALFRDALHASGRVAIAKVALRTRESLAAIRADGKVLVLETLLWPDEVRTPDFGFLDEDTEVRPAELAMASSLIDAMTEDFSPGRYQDSYRQALEKVIEAKIAGGDLVRAAGEAGPAECGAPADLAAMLTASVAAAKAAREGAQAA